jgi:hypothetical protein
MPDHFFTTPDSSEKRIGLVYNSDNQNYQPLDFSKIDDIESLLRNSSSPANIDAFGRLRVSEPFTLADYSHVYGEDTELLTKTSGVNSNISFDILKAKAVLQVGTGVNDFTIHQSRMYHHYMPGKSQVTLQSFNFTGARQGTNKRIGLFDDRNGIFFMQSGDGSLHFGLRSSVSGYTYDETYSQNNWNTDTCNGSGFSQFNLDPTKTQLFWSDYEWLGVGRVRVGFVHEGSFVTAHQFYNSNLKDSVYMSNPNLPVRCEVRNYSGNSLMGTTRMDQICATVFSEGGYIEAGVDFAKSTTGYRSIAENTTIPTIAIRLKTGYYGQPNRSVVRLGTSQLYSVTQTCSYEFWRLPSGASLIGGSWVSAGDDSVVEYNITATGYNLSGANTFSAGFLTVAAGGQGNTVSTSSNLGSITSAKRGYISQNIDSTDSNIFAILIKNMSTSNNTSTNTLASLQWRETR